MTEERLNDLERYTFSGNDVPVSRATIPAQDLRDLINEVRRLTEYEFMYNGLAK